MTTCFLVDCFLKFFAKHFFENMINAYEINLTPGYEYSLQFFIFCSESINTVKYFFSIERGGFIENIH